MLAGRSSPFLGRERAAVDVDVGPERRSPHYHETCLALESVKESSAAVSKPRGVWLRMKAAKSEAQRGKPKGTLGVYYERYCDVTDDNKKKTST